MLPIDNPHGHDLQTLALLIFSGEHPNSVEYMQLFTLLFCTPPYEVAVSHLTHFSEPQII